MMPDYDMSEFEPSYLRLGGIAGETEVYVPEDNYTQWDSPMAYTSGVLGQDEDAWSSPGESPEDIPLSSGSPCITQAGTIPNSGTWVLGVVDGTCQWIDTTTCS